MEDETPTQRQARLRRERREAKLKAEGTSRLEKITNVSGRQNLPDDPTFSSGPEHPPSNNDSTPTSKLMPNFAPPRQPTSSNDAPQPQEADIRALLRAAESSQGREHDEHGNPPEDPMQQLLSQLMGGMNPGPQSDASATPELPPGLAAMMGSFGGAGEAGQTPAQRQETARNDFIWKVIHAVFAFALGVYVVLTSVTLNDSVVRLPGKTGEGILEDRINLFWAFATVELVLQSTRYFLERGKTTSSLGGWIGTVSTMLPEPSRSYIALIARYSGIWSTVVEDGCVLIFMVGLASWGKGVHR